MQHCSTNPPYYTKHCECQHKKSRLEYPFYNYGYIVPQAMPDLEFQITIFDEMGVLKVYPVSLPPNFDFAEL